jgi:hypothetical protein
MSESILISRETAISVPTSIDPQSSGIYFKRMESDSKNPVFAQFFREFLTFDEFSFPRIQESIARRQPLTQSWHSR